MTGIRHDMLSAAARVARTTIRSRVVFGVVSAVIAAGVAMAVLAITTSSPGHATTAAAPKAAPTPVRAGSTLVASLTTAVPRYTRPGGNPDGTVLATWYGRPSALPVIARKPGWVQVRPNGSTAWLRSAHLTFSQTPYRIVINLSTRHVQMLVSGRVVMNAAAGIGTGSDPTPPDSLLRAVTGAWVRAVHPCHFCPLGCHRRLGRLR